MGVDFQYKVYFDHIPTVQNSFRAERQGPHDLGTAQSCLQSLVITFFLFIVLLTSRYEMWGTSREVASQSVYTATRRLPDECRRGNKHAKELDTVDARLNNRFWNNHHRSLSNSHCALCASADFGFQGRFRTAHCAAEAWCENHFPLLWVRYSRHAH